MPQLYLDNYNDVLRCEEAIKAKRSITMTGLNEAGAVRVLTGAVQSVERYDSKIPGYSWRATILT